MPPTPTVTIRCIECRAERKIPADSFGPTDVPVCEQPGCGSPMTVKQVDVQPSLPSVSKVATAIYRHNTFELRSAHESNSTLTIHLKRIERMSTANVRELRNALTIWLSGKV